MADMLSFYSAESKYSEKELWMWYIGDQWTSG